MQKISVQFRLSDTITFNKSHLILLPSDLVGVVRHESDNRQ